MASGLAIMPLVFTNGVFCTRRTKNGANALSNGNPFVGIMNMDIAGGQILKACDAVSNIAKNSNNALASEITSAEESIRALSKGDKIVGGLGKVMSFTADHINPLICATGAVKVATADDKKEAAISEGLALGTMFASEGLAKKALGMPVTKKFDAKKMQVTKDGLFNISKGAKELIAEQGKYSIIDGKKVIITRSGFLMKNPFIEKQASAIKDFCETTKVLNKSLKFVPGILKGLGFVCASIGGYNLGSAVAEKVTVND